MKKKHKNYIYWGIGIALLLIILYGGSHGWFQFIINLNQPPLAITPLPGEIVREFWSYSVLLSFSPNPACVGNSVTGSIDSNIPNGECTLFYMGEGWTPYETFDLNANGDVSASQVISVVGTVRFQATCCDAQGNCRISNEVSLTVNNCSSYPPPTDSDGDGIPDSTDSDDDNDGYTDQEEINAGTNPTDPSSHPTTSYTCGQGTDINQCGGTCPTGYQCNDVWFGLYTRACTCTTGGDTGTVHPDWKPNGQYYNPTTDEPPIEPSVCCVQISPVVSGVPSILNSDFLCASGCPANYVQIKEGSTTCESTCYDGMSCWGGGGKRYVTSCSLVNSYYCGNTFSVDTDGLFYKCSYLGGYCVPDHSGKCTFN